MIAKHVTRLVLRRYMYRVPEPLRWARFEALGQVSWLKEALDELRPEILPEDPIGAVPDADRQQAFPLSIQPPVVHYSQYRCVQADPLSCQVGCQMDGNVSEQAPFASDFGSNFEPDLVKRSSDQRLDRSSERPFARECDRCSFPRWLPTQSQLVGKKGQYLLGERLMHRGLARQYAGVDVRSEEAVVVREYLLPGRYFSPAEQLACQEAFAGVGGVSLADGRSQDLRVVIPIEAIVDPLGDRCYLINPDIDNSPTLNRYCGQYGKLNSQTVTHVLNQVLQTLICLHEQKFSFPNGQTQTGLVHGNISLDSLLWVNAAHPMMQPFPRRSETLLSDSDVVNVSLLSLPEGFVYLTDFAIWENLFDPTSTTAEKGRFQDDLSALGEVAFFLLNGTTLSVDAKALNPRIDSHWPENTPALLKQFILRLMAIESPFLSAEAARVSLLQLPAMPVVSQYEYRADEILPDPPKWTERVLPLAVMLALLITGVLGWLLLRSRKPLYAGASIPPCCLEAIAAVPQGKYVHASPEAAYWYPLFRTTPDLETSSLAARPTLFDRLKEIHPELTLNARAATSVRDAIASVQSGDTDFAILPLTGDLPSDLSATVIAYDTLVPVVAFSYPDRVKGLPDDLKGQLEIGQLEQIYTGKVHHWQQLSSTPLPLKRYWLADKAMQSLFMQRLQRQLDTDEDVQRDTTDTAFVGNSTEPEALSAILMMRSILQDFEQDFESETVGSIGIAPLSEVVGQCSVYPLALSVAGKAVSPLVFDSGKPVTPRNDLCDRKGSYGPHAAAIRSEDYPLAYPLAVVYPFDNTRSDIGQKLAELLLTQASQQQLVSSGLVSAYPLPSSD